MKKSILKSTIAMIFVAMLAVSCNKTNTTESDMESDIENATTSQDSITSDTSSDTANLKNVDATRLSNGKDSVNGEVTPPNAREQ